MGLGKTFGFPHWISSPQIAASYQELWNVNVISIVLGIANVTSPNNFALLFAAATAQAIRSCTFKKGNAPCL